MMARATLIAALATLLALSAAQEECRPNDNCLLPDCTCFSTESPFTQAWVDFVPQFVVLSFDDAVTVTNMPFYQNIMNTFTNPNGCRATMTFFNSHLYNDYSLVNELHRLGNEIAVHSVSHKPDISNYWKPANYSVWMSEAVDMKEMLKKYARLNDEDIKGFRAPFLENGGDEMYEALYKNGFNYDCSWTALQYTNWFGKEPLGAAYPYTLDFPSKQDCTVGDCPKNVYPGFWVAPMIDLKDVDGNACAMIDACSRNNTDCPEPECQDNVFNFLKENFDLNYNGNRAPMGVFMHHSWILEDEINESKAHSGGYFRFLEYVVGLPNVWLVSMDRVLEWMKNPVPVDDVGDHPAFQCPDFDPVTNCPDARQCTYTDNIPVSGVTEIKMKICTRPCPPNLPWLGNVDGN